MSQIDSLYYENHEETRKTFQWGTYGKDGLDPRQDILLCDISDSHLTNIIKHITTYSESYSVSTFLHMLDEETYRKMHGISVPDYPPFWQK